MQTQFKHDQPTRKQLKAARARLQAKIEREENAKVVERSGGRCEVWTIGVWTDGSMTLRCDSPATEIHHMIGKWRIRGRGESASAERKLHCCATCHRHITEHRYERVGDVTPHFTDYYEMYV